MNRILGSAVLIFSASLLVGACGSDGSPAEVTPPPQVATVEVSPSSPTLNALGASVQLSPVAKDASGNTISGKTFTWNSSAEGVATVQSGVVTAVANGTATITATTDAVSGSTDVTVNQTVSGVAVTPQTATIVTGGTTRLTASPNDANGNQVANRTVTWASADPAVATVDAAGLVTGVAMGSTTIVATSDGTDGSASITVSVLGLVAVSAGGQHTCGVAASGAAYCWGSNSRGQLGIGTGLDQVKPTMVSGGLSFQSVDAGQDHTCGITASGDAYCWGLGNDGKLGDGESTQNLTPALVVGGLTWASVSAGFEHSCGVTTTNVGYCWGNGFAGALGNGSTTNSSMPVLVSGGLAFQSVDAGAFFSCGLTTNGDAYCWGQNTTGQLGNGSQNNSDVPVTVSGGLAFRSLSAGGLHACGITTANVGYCWGRNGSSGQLGDGSSTDSSTPVTVSGALALQSVHADNFHTCAVATSSDAYCWGANGSGALGNGSTIDQTTPVLVSGGLTFQSVSVSLSGFRAHTCGMTTSGVVYCWGSGDDGQLGTGSESGATLPVKVIGQ